MAAAREPTSEIRAELYAQALDARGFRVERRYGLDGWEGMTEAFSESSGAFVVPALAFRPEAEDLPVPRATMLRPTEVGIGGKHPAPLVGDDWSLAHPKAVRALNETTAELDAAEFAGMVEAVEDGTSVVGAVYEWRARNGLPPASGVRPSPAETEEVRAMITETESSGDPKRPVADYYEEVRGG